MSEDVFIDMLEDDPIECPTPETDAARLNISCDDSSCGIYCHTADDSEYTGEVCRADRMADLERERDKARAELAQYRAAVQTLAAQDFGAAGWNEQCNQAAILLRNLLKKHD